MKFPRNAKIFRGQLDVAPFASDFFLLTIFMVFSSLLISSPGVKINLPVLSGEGLSRPSLPKLDIAVTASGKIIFESQEIAPDQLKPRLKASVDRFTNHIPSLVLQADVNADLETLLQICQTAVDVGIEQTVWLGRRQPFTAADPTEPQNP